jgi:hypothetical protein
MVERGATTRKGPEIPISYRWQNRAAHVVMLQRLRVIKKNNINLLVNMIITYHLQGLAQTHFVSWKKKWINYFCISRYGTWGIKKKTLARRQEALKKLSRDFRSKGVQIFQSYLPGTVLVTLVRLSKPTDPVLISIETSGKKKHWTNLWRLAEYYSIPRCPRPRRT